MAQSNWDFGTLGDAGEAGWDVLKNIGKSAVKGTMDMSDIVVGGGSTLIGTGLEAVGADSAGKVFKDIGSGYHDAVEESKKTINEEIAPNTSAFSKTAGGKKTLDLLSDYGDLLIPGAGTIKGAKLLVQGAGKGAKKFIKVGGLKLAKEELENLVSGKFGKDVTVAFKDFVANTGNHTPEKVAEFVKKFPQSGELFKDYAKVAENITEKAIPKTAKATEQEAIEAAEQILAKRQDELSKAKEGVSGIEIENSQNIRSSISKDIQRLEQESAKYENELNIFKQKAPGALPDIKADEKMVASLRAEYAKTLGPIKKLSENMMALKGKLDEAYQTGKDPKGIIKQLENISAKILKEGEKQKSIMEEGNKYKKIISDKLEETSKLTKETEKYQSGLGKLEGTANKSKEQLTKNKSDLERLDKRGADAQGSMDAATKNLEEATKEVEKMKGISEQAAKERLYEMAKNLGPEAVEAAIEKVGPGPIRNAYNFLKENKLMIISTPIVGYGMKKAKGDEDIFQSDNDNMIPPSDGVIKKDVGTGEAKKNIPQGKVVEKYRGYEITKNPDGTFSFPSKQAGRVGLDKTGFKTVKEATDYIESQNLQTKGDVKEQTDSVKNISDKELSNVKVKYEALKKKNPNVNLGEMVKKYMINNKYDLSELGKKQLAMKFGIQNYTGTPEQDFAIVQQISQEEEPITMD